MQEFLEMKKIKKQIQNRRKGLSYEQESIQELINHNLICEDEADFLVSFMEA